MLVYSGFCSTEYLMLSIDIAAKSDSIKKLCQVETRCCALYALFQLQ